MAISEFKVILLLVLFGTFLLQVHLEKVNLDDVTVVFYYGTTRNSTMVYPLRSAYEVVNHPKFTHNMTYFFIPDFYESQLLATQENVQQYIKIDRYNFLALDYGAIEVNKIDRLSPLIADWIIKMWDHIDYKSFSILAYANGCQLAADAGRRVKTKTSYQRKIERITYLEPPKNMSICGKPIEQDVQTWQIPASFLDVVHTSSWSTRHRLGHVDFWPTNGESQPACEGSDDKLCNRKLSYQFWAESVRKIDRTGIQFCSYPAKNYKEFKKTDVKNLGQSILMGINCDQNARGDYYLDTWEYPPFAKGCLDE